MKSIKKYIYKKILTKLFTGKVYIMASVVCDIVIYLQYINICLYTSHCFIPLLVLGPSYKTIFFVLQSSLSFRNEYNAVDGGVGVRMNRSARV